MKNTLPAVGSNRLLDSGGSRSGSTSGTRVVHVLSGEPYDIYIGRAMPRFGLKASKWQNPFKLRDYDDPTKCLQDYKEHLRNRLLMPRPLAAGMDEPSWEGARCPLPR